jgi:hypothetical protein
MPSRPLKTPSPRDIAAEILRRVAEANASTGGGYVVRLSDPPTPQERLQVLAAHLERRPIVIMPHKSKTVEEWMARYAPPVQRRAAEIVGHVRRC